jgi:hypothetical protein
MIFIGNTARSFVVGNVPTHSRTALFHFFLNYYIPRSGFNVLKRITEVPPCSARWFKPQYLVTLTILLNLKKNPLFKHYIFISGRNQTWITAVEGIQSRGHSSSNPKDSDVNDLIRGSQILAELLHTSCISWHVKFNRRTFEIQARCVTTDWSCSRTGCTRE